MTFSIQFQDKFNALVKAAAITEEEETVAKFFWYAGLRHAFQRGTSQAALFNPVPTAPQQEPVTPRPPFASLNKQAESNNAKRYKGYDSELSAYEAKLLSLLLAQVITDGKNRIDSYERLTNSMWKFCDKDVKKTEETFKEMNRRKSKLNRTKGQMNALVQAQRKLKKISKGL